MSPKLPPGPGGPRLLNTIKWQRDPAGVMEASRERYGDLWTLRLSGGTTFVIVTDPELIEAVFNAGSAVLHGGEAKKQVAEPMLGAHSLLLVDGAEHTSLRKLMLPPFHRERMQRYHGLITQICEEELATWPLNEPMPLLPRMQAITLKVIMSAIFGATGGAAQEKLHARIRDMHDYAGKALRMMLLFISNSRGKEPPKAFLRVREPLDAVIFEEIDRARNDPNLAEREDILAMLVQARHDDGSPMSDRELRDQMMTLLVQGHTSTAGALAWAFERLIRNPEMLERLRAEAETGSEDYLDAVMKETLRLRPSIPITTRLVKEPYQLGDYEIEPGITIAPCIYMLHNRGDLYPEPDRFRPERFLEQEPPANTWIPFGGGERYCIGRSFATAEIKAVVRTIALRTRLEPLEQAGEGIVRQATTIAPSRGAMAVLKERVPEAGAASAARG